MKVEIFSYVINDRATECLGMLCEAMSNFMSKENVEVVKTVEMKHEKRQIVYVYYNEKNK